MIRLSINDEIEHTHNKWEAATISTTAILTNLGGNYKVHFAPVVYTSPLSSFQISVAQSRKVSRQNRQKFPPTKAKFL